MGIASVRGHPALMHAFCKIMERAANGLDVRQMHFVHRHTGPGVWTRALQQVLRLDPEVNRNSSRYQYNQVNHELDQCGVAQASGLGICLFDWNFTKNLTKNTYLSMWSKEERGNLPSWLTQRQNLANKRGGFRH